MINKITLLYLSFIYFISAIFDCLITTCAFQKLGYKFIYYETNPIIVYFTVNNIGYLIPFLMIMIPIIFCIVSLILIGSKNTHRIIEGFVIGFIIGFASVMICVHLYNVSMWFYLGIL